MLAKEKLQSGSHNPSDPSADHRSPELAIQSFVWDRPHHARSSDEQHQSGATDTLHSRLTDPGIDQKTGNTALEPHTDPPSHQTAIDTRAGGLGCGSVATMFV